MSEEVKNPMMEYAAQKFATESPAISSTSEIEEPAPATNETVTPEATAIVDPITPAPDTTEPEQQTEEPAVDYSKFLSENSDGLFTDVDSFKSALPKIKEYDTLLSSKAELEEKLKVDPFVNEFTKTLDGMIRAGKSPDEIEAFTKISRLDIDGLSAIDAKVMAMVKSGYSEPIARQIVQSEFPIEDYEEGTQERTILEEKLRVSSLTDRSILKEWKKDLTTVDTSAQQAQEQERLNAIAKAETHKQTVKQVIPKIVESITGLGEKNLNGKEGEEAVKLKFDYNAYYKAQLPTKLESFFIDGQMEINEDNVALAQKYIRADYLEKNFDQISQSIFKHAEALTTERMVNKYENRSGLPAESTNVVVDNSKQEYNDFLAKIAKSR